MGYEAAEQAYGEHRFAEAQELLNEHLKNQPDDPRAVLLQAYIYFYGFQDTAAAASSYRRVLELKAEGPYRELATEGLKHCPVSERQTERPEPLLEKASTTEPTEDERPPATPWLAELTPQPDRREQPKAEPDPEPMPEKPQEAPQETVSYAMAEQAYQEQDFVAVQKQLDALLAQSPNDLRCLLLQGYVSSFGFQDEPTAIKSYQRVLELEAEGPYRDLAINGLSQCGVNLDPAPAEPQVSEPDPVTDVDLSSLADAIAETESPKPEATEVDANPKPELIKSQEAPKATVSYAMAEQAYQDRDFNAAQELLSALLAQSPNDLRCLLLQGYVSSFGFQDEPAAIKSYQRVLALEAEGPYRDLAIEGMSQCGVNLDPAPAEPQVSEPDPVTDVDLSSLVEAVAEPVVTQPERKSKKAETNQSTKKASEQALADGWLLVDLSSPA